MELAKTDGAGGEFAGIVHKGSDAPVVALQAQLLKPAPKIIAIREKFKGIQLQIKWVTSQVLKHKDMTTAMAHFPGKLAKTLVDTIKDASPTAMVHVKLPDDFKVLHNDLFMPQAWFQTETHFHIGACPYGLTEFRVLFDGSYLLAGVKFDEVQGAGLHEKIQTVLTPEGAAQFLTNCQAPAKGFFVQHDEPHSMFVQPPGFVTMVAGCHSPEKGMAGSSGMRWSAIQGGSKAELTLVFEMVKSMILAYPQLQETEYREWARCLEESLIPAAM